MRLERVRGSGAVGRCVVRTAVGWVAAGFTAHAFALGLGEPIVNSVLGQPLQMTVPLVMDAGTELPQECVRIIPGSQLGDAIPSLNVGRITIDAAGRRLGIESLQPIDEPTLRVVLEVGCDQRIRREFSLLLDPPSVGVPLANGSGGSARSARAESSLGLGMAQISAVLGQRLSIRVPVVGSDAGSLTADCVHLADPVSGEGAPVLRQAQIRVVPQDTGSVIEVVTSDPVTEPAVRLALDVGCRDPLRREYAVLLGLPTLAVSNSDATLAGAEPKPPEPAAKPAPKRPTKPRRVASAGPVAPAPAQKNAESERPAAEVPAKVAQAPAARADRLVLSSPDESARPAAPSSGATAATDPNAELLKRLDAMSKRIETLEAELAASREREHEMERRAAATREQWTWSMGALGAMLLVGALVIVWRQRRPSPEPAWEPVVTRPAQSVAKQSAAVPVIATPRSRESPEIGGRATMAPAPSTTGVATEPSLQEEHGHSQITVTELHDTVQVIKELYATVLERNTSSATGTSTGAKPSRPLELDLATPPSVGPPAAASDGPKSRPGGEEQRAADERFTELPTEMGLDLDLSSVAMPAAPQVVADVGTQGGLDWTSPEVPQPAVSDEPAVDQQPAVAPAPAQSAVAQEVVIVRGHAVAPSSEASKGPNEFQDEQLTSTPTEVLIDIDVGTVIDEPSTIAREAPRFSLPRRPEPEQPADTPSSLDPIDLQLDLPETKPRRRAGR